MLSSKDLHNTTINSAIKYKIEIILASSAKINTAQCYKIDYLQSFKSYLTRQL